MLKYNMDMFNIWLTGLIEGDGTIIIPQNKFVASATKTKKQYPFIRIAFHRKDLPLATWLSEKLGYGKIWEDKGAKNSVLWTVSSTKELLDLIARLNGNMRTPKIYRLNKLIDWYNEDFKSDFLVKKDLDISPIESNSWLSGMSDADSNFNIIITPRKNGNYRVSRQWRLEFAQKTYYGMDQAFWAMQISAFLNTNLLTRSRVIEFDGVRKTYSSFIVVAHNKESLKIIETYFNKFPLFSSKYLDFKDWEDCGLYSNVKSKENYDNIFILKNNMNNKRVRFNWNHLHVP